MADVTTAGQGLAGRKRVRADTATGTGYRTFPARVPALLAVLGGGMTILGALGAGIRASALASAREDPKQIGILMGHSEATGWLLAVGGLLAAVAGLGWLGRRRLPKLVAAVAALGLGLGSAARLASLDRRAAEWAGAARRQPDFIGYHAGLGWGAWLMLVGAILCAFAVLIGVLREIDRRKGIDA